MWVINFMSWFPLFFCPSVCALSVLLERYIQEKQGQCSSVINVTFYETLIDYCPDGKNKQIKTIQNKSTENQHHDLRERCTAVRMNCFDKRDIMIALKFCD